MKKIFTYLSGVLFAVLFICKVNGQSVVSGTLVNPKDSIISVLYRTDPITGLLPAETQKDFKINADGTFFIPIDEKLPVRIWLHGNNYNFQADVFLFNKGKLNVWADCDNLPESLKFDRINRHLNAFYSKWSGFYRGANKKLQDVFYSYSSYKRILDSLEYVSFKMLHDYNTEYELNDNEFQWLAAEIRYSKFTLLLSRAYRLQAQPNDPAFGFFQFINLKDNKASVINNAYNSLVQDHILHDVNSKGYFYSAPDDNSRFFAEYYNSIIQNLTGKVKDVILTRFILDLLDKNNMWALEYYEKYLNDCSSQEMIKETVNPYNKYLEISDAKLPDKTIIIPTNNQNPFEVISRFKGKVLYLDFWASWCGPCIEAMPNVKDIARHYQKQDLAILHIGNNDEKTNLLNAIKKYNLSGFHVLLSKEETEAWRKEFNIHGIPSYLLIDSQGKVVNMNAPHPDTKEIYVEINELLTE